MTRRLLLFSLFTFAAVAAEPRALVTAVDSIALTVSDLDRSVAFYTELLGFEKVRESEASGDLAEHLHGVFGLRTRTARLKLGDEALELTEYLAPKGRPAPLDARSHDRWFQHVAIITNDMQRAYAWLRRHKVTHASPGPQRLPDWNKQAGGIEAFYFRDPDGHPLEILAFPEGKGAPKWHKASERLFLGIDHTAIAVADSDASLRFYRDTLGMMVAGESENYGIEQERLNNVFGARLRITALRAGAGPGVELLEYLAPADGRPYPADAKPNDLLHWATRFVAPDPAAAEMALRKARAAFVSTGLVTLDGGAAALIARDPDRHAIEIFNPPSKNISGRE